MESSVNVMLKLSSTVALDEEDNVGGKGAKILNDEDVSLINP